MSRNTLFVNLFGGPGTGKSTTAALLFGQLKEAGVNAELVTEFAKDVVWEDRRVIACQPYVFGKQLWRLERLRGKVDVVVTDAPLVLSLVYAEALGEAWKQVVLAQTSKFNNMNVFLVRDNIEHPYNPEGRYQKDVEEAETLDRKIKDVLNDARLPYHVVPVHRAADKLATRVREELKQAQA